MTATIGAADRLQEIQRLLDRLNDASRPDVFVRDARWLIQTAQGPLTRHLRAVLHGSPNRLPDRSRTPTASRFTRPAPSWPAAISARSSVTARRETAPADRRSGRSRDHAQLELHGRGAAGPRSRPAARGVRDGAAPDATWKRGWIWRTPSSRACRRIPSCSSRAWICSTPCTMIEDLFIDRGDGRPRAIHAAWVTRHLGLLERYGELDRRSRGVSEGRRRRRSIPSQRVYSPLGIAYGFCADILSNMALRHAASHHRRLASVSRTCSSAAAASTTNWRGQLGWETLPRREGEREHFEHSVEWAGQMFERMMNALERPGDAQGRTPMPRSVPDARLFVVPASRSVESLPEGFLPDGIVAAQEHCLTSDLKRALVDRRHGLSEESDCERQERRAIPRERTSPTANGSASRRSS